MSMDGDVTSNRSAVSCVTHAIIQPRQQLELSIPGNTKKGVHPSTRKDLQSKVNVVEAIHVDGIPSAGRCEKRWM